MESQEHNKNLNRLRAKSKKVASLLKQMSHPQRLLILCFLNDSEKSVSEIENACGASQSAVSQFLKAMRLEGLLSSRRNGRCIYYKIADKKVHKLMQSLFQIFC